MKLFASEREMKNHPLDSHYNLLFFPPKKTAAAEIVIHP